MITKAAQFQGRGIYMFTFIIHKNIVVPEQDKEKLPGNTYGYCLYMSFLRLPSTEHKIKKSCLNINTKILVPSNRKRFFIFK